MRINFHILFFLFSLYSSFAQTEVKFNLATAAVLVPNIGIEIKTTELKSIQLDVLGSFWDSLWKTLPHHSNHFGAPLV